MHIKFRLAGWLAVGGLLAAALIAPASVSATDLHAAHQSTSWNAEGFQSNDCETTPGPGQVVWHFVLTTPNHDSGHLTATFEKAGEKTVANLDKPSTTLHFEIVTGHDTLLDAETTDVDGGNLNLSHICVGTDRESQSAPVETAEPFRSRPLQSRPPAPTATATVPAETATAPVETASGSGRDGHVSPPRRRASPLRPPSLPAETATIPAESHEPLAEPGHQPAVPELPAGREPERQGRRRDGNARRGRHARRPRTRSVPTAPLRTTAGSWCWSRSPR